jgi:hypothetical protein
MELKWGKAIVMYLSALLVFAVFVVSVIILLGYASHQSFYIKWKEYEPEKPCGGLRHYKDCEDYGYYGLEDGRYLYAKVLFGSEEGNVGSASADINQEILKQAESKRLLRVGLSGEEEKTLEIVRFPELEECIARRIREENGFPLSKWQADGKVDSYGSINSCMYLAWSSQTGLFRCANQDCSVIDKVELQSYFTGEHMRYEPDVELQDKYLNYEITTEELLDILSKQ